MSLSQQEIAQLNPLQLAYIGDAVYELLIRENALSSGHGMQALHKKTTSYVCAPGQAMALETVLGLLTEDELDLVKRGRNTHARHAGPKSASTAEYASATGLEALIGYLYLMGKSDRVKHLIDVITQTEMTR